MRGRWTFPTFATVGALAAFLLVRGTIFREARRPLGEAPAERIGAGAGAPAVSPPPAPPRPQDFEAGEMKGALGSAERRRALLETTEDAAPGGRDDDRPFKRKGPSPHRTRGAVPGGSGQGEVLDREDEIGSGALRKAPSRPAKRDANRTSPLETNRPGGASVPDDGRKRADRQDDLRKGGGVDVKASAERSPAPVPGPAAASAPAPSSATLARQRTGGGGPALDVETRAGTHPAAAVAPSRADDLLEGSLPSSREGSAGFAQPPAAPPPRSRHVASDEGSAAPSASKPSAGAIAPALSAPAARAAEPPRPASAPASAPVREMTAEKKAKTHSADKVEAAAEQVEERAAAPTVDPAIALSDRAAKLLAARRFTEASAAYRDLLRRFPDHPSAPLWRSRLVASDRAASKSTGFATPPPPK